MPPINQAPFWSRSGFRLPDGHTQSHCVRSRLAQNRSLAFFRCVQRFLICHTSTALDLGPWSAMRPQVLPRQWQVSAGRRKVSVKVWVWVCRRKFGDSTCPYTMGNCIIGTGGRGTKIQTCGDIYLTCRCLIPLRESGTMSKWLILSIGRRCEPEKPDQKISAVTQQGSIAQW